jgi:hypothetical protein
MKILLIGEFSGLQNELKHALIQLGHNATLAAANDFYKKYPADINLGFGENLYSYKLRQLVYPFIQLNKMTGYDVVHLVSPYIAPRFIGLNIYLLKFLKKNNNIVTLSGAGDDPFFVTYSEKTMRYSPIPWNEKIDRKGKPHHMRSEHQLNIMKQYAGAVDRVIPIMYEYHSTFCAAGYEEKTEKPIPIPIDLKKHKIAINYSSKKLVFFHGLNRPGFKGSFMIESAFNQLAKKYPNDVECVIKGRMAFNDYLEILTKTNISVDQVFSYSLAMNALYSMAQGKVVCGGAEVESNILYGGALPPVFNLEPNVNQILDVFEEILERRSSLESIAHLSRDFVERHHDSLSIAQRYINCWRSI